MPLQIKHIPELPYDLDFSGIGHQHFPDECLRQFRRQFRCPGKRGEHIILLRLILKGQMLQFR